MSLRFPDEFQPVCRYVMKGGKPQDIEILDTKLWGMSGVVYARLCDDKIVYIGSTDRLLSTRIGREHLRGIATSMRGTAPRFIGELKRL